MCDAQRGRVAAPEPALTRPEPALLRAGDPLFSTTIKVDEKDVPLAVYEGDSPASVATDFAVAHKLDQDGAMAVFYHLKQVGRSPSPAAWPADPVADGPGRRAALCERRKRRRRA